MSSVWTPMRLELRAWFRKHAGALAPAYEGAVELLAKPGFPGRVQFIAHAVRDIADRLVFAIEPQRRGQRVQYEEYLNKIESQWISPNSICQHEAALSPPESVSVPRKLAVIIDALVLSHRERMKRPRMHELLFQFLVKSSLSPPASIDRLVKEFGKIAKWFMAQAHFAATLRAAVDERDLLGNFQAFEGAIFGMIGTYFAGTDTIDEILQRANR